MGEIVEMGSAKHRWWKEAVVYQVSSFFLRDNKFGRL